MDVGALQNALETGGRFWIVADRGHQRSQVVIDIVCNRLAQVVDTDAAGVKDLCRVFVVHQRKQQML